MRLPKALFIACRYPTVSLGVKGTPQGVATAELDWTTPATPGHYCIQVSFSWPDDLNPNNNLGQENTQVVKAALRQRLRLSFATEIACDDISGLR
jgi:hypothetical protein